jgi:hypothetical protein
MRKTGAGHHFYLVIHRSISSLYLKFNNKLSKNQYERKGIYGIRIIIYAFRKVSPVERP